MGGEGVPTAPKWTWGTYGVGTWRAQRRSPSGLKKSEVRVVRSCSKACRRPPSPASCPATGTAMRAGGTERAEGGSQIKAGGHPETSSGKPCGLRKWCWH